MKYLGLIKVIIIYLEEDMAICIKDDLFEKYFSQIPKCEPHSVTEGKAKDRQSLLDSSSGDHKVLYKLLNCQFRNIKCQHVLEDKLSSFMVL